MCVICSLLSPYIVLYSLPVTRSSHQLAISFSKTASAPAPPHAVVLRWQLLSTNLVRCDISCLESARSLPLPIDYHGPSTFEKTCQFLFYLAPCSALSLCILPAMHTCSFTPLATQAQIPYPLSLRNLLCPFNPLHASSLPGALRPFSLFLSL